MPSVTDLQQQSGLTNTTEKSTLPPSTQQTTSTDLTNTDPLTQAILITEKKQRNLGKRKEKLESYQEEAKKGKELNKDQKDALAKYSDVLGQIECLKELNEQLKKIQTESIRNQKRALKQAADEKRLLISQNLRQYAQIRYLLEHRSTSLQSEESLLLDQLSAVIIPSDNSPNSISRSVDTVLSIYQTGPSSIIKNLTGKNPQEVREILESLIQSSNTASFSSSSSTLPQPSEPEPEPEPEQEQEQEQEQTKEVEQTNDIQQLSNVNFNEYPLQFDTRSQNISLEQIIQDNTFFSIDLNNQIQENQGDGSPDTQEYIPSMTVVNSNMNDQPSSLTDDQKQDEQQTDGQWQQRRGNGNNYRGGQFNNGNRNFNRGGGGGLNHYYQQSRRGPRGGRYDNSYSGGGQRSYNENNRGRGGHRGHRGGGYRGYNNNNSNGNGYQKFAQHQQVHSAPPSSSQQ